MMEELTTSTALLSAVRDSGEYTEQDIAREEVVKEDAQEPQIDRSDLWLVKYDELALKTNNIPLSHLSCCRWKP